MVSPEMLPFHLRDIRKRLIGAPSTLKYDRMVLEQAAQALEQPRSLKTSTEFLMDFNIFLTTFDDSIGAYDVRERIIQFVNSWHFNHARRR